VKKTASTTIRKTAKAPELLRVVKAGAIPRPAWYFSRPSPRSGVRLPLGAHPLNTGGKKGRSGRRRLHPIGAELFGDEYFNQPLTERPIGGVEDDELLRNAQGDDLRNPKEETISGALRVRAREGHSERRQQQIEEQIEEGRTRVALDSAQFDVDAERRDELAVGQLAARGIRWVRESHLVSEGRVISEWDPFA